MPLSDFVVSRNAILGITKSGKTYTAKGVAEQLLDLDIPIIVFDAIGVWRYLKTPGDKSNSKGYKIVVAGGENPDLPLNIKSAPEIVRSAIKENIPLIIDLYDSKLSKADWRRIVQSCFRVLLYENKGLRHVFLEESAEFAPQKVTDGETYAEVEKLARMGGNKGVGITFINQRAQELNKAVLELCDNIVLLRQRGSHAIDSLEKWMDRLAPATAKEIAATMPQMTQGDCWIFTENDEVPVRTRSTLIKSLHPDRRMPEQALQNRKTMDAKAFVEQLNTALPKLAEEAKENDPAILKKRIAELERAVNSKAKEPVPVLSKSDIKMIDGAVDLVTDALITTEKHANTILQELAGLRKFIGDLKTSVDKASPLSTPHKTYCPPSLPAIHQRKPEIYRPPVNLTPIHNGTPEHVGIPEGEAKILAACIQFPPGVKRNQLTVLTGYKRSSRDAYIARLKGKELVETFGDTVKATGLGFDALPNAQPLPTGEALQQYWMERLPEGEKKIFDVLLKNYPDPVTRGHLSEVTGYKRSSRDAYLSRMAAKMITDEPERGMVKAAEQLFI